MKAIPRLEKLINNICDVVLPVVNSTNGNEIYNKRLNLLLPTL